MKKKRICLPGEIMNNSEGSIISKYVAPTKYDHAPAKTIWKVIDQSENYIQVSEDENNPQWEYLGTFLEKSLGNLINNKQFIDECYRSFLYNKNNPLTNISGIIKESQK
jgi:hypothetical protein